MAEVLALGASVIAIVQVADRIIGLCKFYIETARDAPSDLKTIFIETSAVKTTLESLEYLHKHGGINSKANSIGGPIEGCYQTLAALEKLFPDGGHKSTKGKKSKKTKLELTMTSLAWPLKETKARKLLDELVRYKTTINLALTTGIAQDVRCIKEETSRIHEMLSETQSQEVYTWLQHTDPSSIHHRACKNYEPGTGTWIWKIPEWTEWLACKHRAIHIHGIPGAGKTVLMSYLIEQIEKHCEQIANRNCIYVYYYCYFAHKQDETKPFLKWLIGRLCREAGSTGRVPMYVSDLRRHGAEPSLADLLGTIAQLLTSFETVFVAIDAIDESQSRSELLDVLQILAKDPKFSKLQIVTSGRQYRDIEQVMLNISQFISLSNPFVEQDIRQYVHSTLQSSPYFQKWPRDLLNEVEESVALGASGMFRWAVCQIDIIRRLKNERTIIQNALKTLPKTLYETYDKIVQSIPEEDRIFVYYALQWIAFRNELSIGNAFPYMALIGAAEASILRLTGSPNVRFYDRDVLAGVCGCLINIGFEDPFYMNLRDESGNPNDGATFAHYSVQEYLDSTPAFRSLLGHYALIGADLKVHLLDVALTETQRLNENEQMKAKSSLPKYDRLKDNHKLHTWELLWFCCTDFRFYSILLATVSLFLLHDHIGLNEALEVLTIDFLDPSRPHYRVTEEMVVDIDDYLELKDVALQDYAGPVFFWRIKWDAKTDNDTKHLGNLIFLALSQKESLSLVKKFLRMKDRRGLLHAQTCFCLPSTNFHYSPYMLDISFTGSFVEIFAQLASEYPQTFHFLIEVSADIFNPSVVLSQYLGGFYANDRHKTDSVQRLLELGANPNPQGYRITPLQIASLTGDWEEVEKLLRAGAQPNNTGAPDGVAWNVGSLMYYILPLLGVSPLRICTSFGTLFQTQITIEGRKRAEKLLLNYGAKDFVSSSFDTSFKKNKLLYRG